MALIHTETVKGKKSDDASDVAKEVATRLGVKAFGRSQTHYVNTSETDDGLLVEVHEHDKT